MSAFALIFHRDGRPVDRAVFERLLGVLDHRGPDGKRAVMGTGFALGHQRFRTTPEERQEEQPVIDRMSAALVLLDGRLDNRTQLCNWLAIDAQRRRSITDAEIVLAAYRKWGEQLFEKLLGSFAIVVLDPRRRRVVCGRDPLGNRGLFYFLEPGLLIVASEEVVLLTHPAVSLELNETSIARFYAVAAPKAGETFFASIHELPPGHALTVDQDVTRLWRHWQPRLDRCAPDGKDEEYAEHFRELLGESVRCRLRSATPPAVLMSGGLDSTSVAAMASLEQHTSFGHKPLRTVSWFFDELPEVDERRYIDAVAKHHALDTRQFSGGDGWPLADPDSWPRNPNSPLEGLYRRLRQRAYSMARQAGSTVLLTGEYGDNLYSRGIFWLRDMVRAGRFGMALRSLAVESLRGRSAARMRTTLACAFGKPKSGAADWLTPYARDLVAAGGSSAASSVPESGNLLDPAGANAVVLEAANASRCGVELRRPYRDLRLVEFFLSVPAHHLYRPGWSKWILRQATSGLLPEVVRLRREVTSLHPLAVRGLVEREAATVRELLEVRGADWRRYVRSDWLAEVFPDRLAAGLDGTAAVVPWRCLCMELWLRSGVAGAGIGSVAV